MFKIKRDWWNFIYLFKRRCRLFVMIIQKLVAPCRPFVLLQNGGWSVFVWICFCRDQGEKSFFFGADAYAFADSTAVPTSNTTKPHNKIISTWATIYIFLYYSLRWFQKCLFYCIILCSCGDIDSRKMCNSPRVNSSTTAARKHMKLQENVQNKMILMKLLLFSKTAVSFVCNGHPKVGSTVPTVRSTHKTAVDPCSSGFFCRRSRGKNHFLALRQRSILDR